MKIDLRKIKTFYINLDKDTIRNESMQQLVSDFGFTNAERSAGEYRAGDPLSGCAASHFNILSTNKTKTIILEDDCVLKRNTPVIEVPDDADAIYLGLSEWGYFRDVSKRENFTFIQHNEYKNVYKVNGMLATHAILYLNKDYMKMCEIVSKFSADNSVHVDQGFARIQRYFNVYALAEPIFYQSSNTEATDIVFKKDRIIGVHN